MLVMFALIFIIAFIMLFKHFMIKQFETNEDKYYLYAIACVIAWNIIPRIFLSF